MKKIIETEGKHQKNKTLLTTLYEKETPVQLKINGNTPIPGKIGFGISVQGKPFFRPLNLGAPLESNGGTNTAFHFVPMEQPLPIDQGYPIHLKRMDIGYLSENVVNFSARITPYDPNKFNPNQERVTAEFHSTFK